jgi:hypothetical protein
MDRASLRDFISRQRYAVVSSTASDGTPQSALVGVAATSGLEIIFDTLDSARKYRNLIERPACSLVIGGWSGEQTLQLEGLAEAPAGESLRRLQHVFFAHWPECREHLKWPGIAYLVVHPCWLRYSDFDRTPPVIQELSSEDLLHWP